PSAAPSCRSRTRSRSPRRTDPAPATDATRRFAGSVNVTMLLDMAADGFGDRVVVGTREEGLTATRLRDLAAGTAALVRASGADSVLYLAVNGPAFPVALFGAARAGVPL